MSQRISGYRRVPDERYETVAWPIAALLLCLNGVGHVWDPCDRGSGCLVATLRDLGVETTGTSADFFTFTAPPPGVTDLVTNPPYGQNRRSELAVRFIEQALKLDVARVSMLLRNDFDSASTRQHLFRNNPFFAGKVTLLTRIKWFAGPSSPSDNHSWFLWNRAYAGAPSIQYVTRDEAEAVMNRIGRERAERHEAVGIPAGHHSLNGGEVEQRIYDAVRQHPGITIKELRAAVWANDPAGEPANRTALHIHVSRLNHLLAPLGVAVRSAGGKYQIIRGVTP
jgi:hypothetical protein